MSCKTGIHPVERVRLVRLALFLLGTLSLSPLTAQQPSDCNGNGLLDADDVVAGTSVDCNANDVPDECEALVLDRRSLSERELVAMDDVPRALLLEDFNGDGVDDLFVGTSDGFAVSHGAPGQDPGVGEGVQVPTEGSARRWKVADLDGDGNADVVGGFGSEVAVWLGDGDGAFGAPVSVLNESGLNAIAVGDVNGDDAADIVVAHRVGDAVLIIKARADGFDPAVSREVGESPIAVEIGDLDGDSAVDLVVANRDSDDLTVLLGDADGQFATQRSVPTGRTRPQALVLADLNNDGALDIAVFHSDAVLTFVNPGDGSFAEPDVFLHVLAQPIAAAAGDLNGDGILDLTSASAVAGVRVFLGDGSGRLVAQVGVAANVDRLSAMDLADTDQDNDLDFLLGTSRASQGRPSVVLVANQESRGPPSDLFNDRLDYPIGSDVPLHNAHGIALLDVEGDADLDVASVHGDGRSVGINHNDGDGALTADGVLWRLAARLDPVIAGDVDGDTDADLITGGLGAGFLYVLSNDGTGDFSSWDSYSVRGGANMLSAADMDGDGSLDILFPNTTRTSVTLFRNSGAGTFDRGQDLRVGARPTAVVPVDLDGDGDLDIAASNENSSNVSLLIQGDEGSFTAAASLPVLSAPLFLVTADFDLDGDGDLATANEDASASIFLNEGDGSFAPAIMASLGERPFSMLVADLSGDGLPDLISTNERPGALTVLTGRDRGQFSSPFMVPLTGLAPRFSAVGDMDGDDDLDMVSGNRGSRTLSVFLNTTVLGSAAAFLDRLCTVADFLDVSAVASPDSIVVREAQYILPARDGEGLLPTTFPSLGRFPIQHQFLPTVFPERFPSLDASEYMALVGRRATRDYFAGTIGRLRFEDEIVYGFDVVVDESTELEGLTLEEVRQVFETLKQSFTLEPLGYLPRTTAARERAASWEEPGFPVYLVEGPPGGEPVPEGTPTFTLEIPEGLTICGTFAAGTVDRDLAEEYELKSTLRFHGGVIELPTTEDLFARDLFEAILFGPARALADPLSPGVFRLLKVPGAGGVTFYRFTYSQEFVLPDGRRLDVSWVRPIQLRARGEEKLDEGFVITEELFAVEVGTETLQATLDGEPLLRYGSCTYETLPRFEVRVEATDGTRLRIEERFREEESLLATGPAAVWRMDVELGGERRVVRDYWNLVYSAQKHNTMVRYRVVLEESVQLEGVGRVGALDVTLADPPESIATVAYLDSEFGALGESAGTYAKTPLKAEPLFLRGDATGDGRIDVTDGLTTLHYLFRGEVLACAKAADANDDGRLNVVDAVRIVAELFQGGEGLPEPFPSCGTDGTADGLACDSAQGCR